MLGDPGFRQQSQGAMRSRRHRRRVQAGVDIYSTRRQREHCERGRGGGRFATPNPVQTIAHNFAALAWGFGGGGDGANITCTGPPAPPPLHVRSSRCTVVRYPRMQRGQGRDNSSEFERRVRLHALQLELCVAIVAGPALRAACMPRGARRSAIRTSVVHRRGIGTRLIARANL